MVLLSFLGALTMPFGGATLLRIALLFSLSAALIVVVGVFVREVYQVRPKTSHLHRIGLSSSSNLKDQHDTKYGEVSKTMRVKAIKIHPIKSCKPIELEQAKLTKTGFEYDRWFALATCGKEGQWQFCSQRTKPSMALVHQEIWLPNTALTTAGDGPVKDPGQLVVRFPDLIECNIIRKLQTILETSGEFMEPMASFAVPLRLSNPEIEQMGLKYKNFTIHGQQTCGLDMGTIPGVATVLPKLHAFLGIPKSQTLTLLQCTTATLRRTDTNLAPLRHIGTPSMHSYSDEQPVHIINLPSVHETSKYLPQECQPLDARRFRPNIFMTGAPAFSEETWKRFRITSKTPPPIAGAHSGATISVVCRTGRCTMPSVNPDTGVPEHDNPPAGKKKGKLQPSMTLKEYRDVEANNKTALGFLGMHCVPEDRDLQTRYTWISVGDEIEVLETGDHLTGSTANEY